jgi:hypothetical protein
MPTHKHTRRINARARKNTARKTGRSADKHTPAIVLGLLCIVSAFSLGIETAGDMATVETIEAAEPAVITIAGDLDGNGIVTAKDAMIAVDTIRSGREAPSDVLAADPSGDSHLTIDDVLFILRHASR